MLATAILLLSIQQELPWRGTDILPVALRSMPIFNRGFQFGEGIAEEVAGRCGVHNSMFVFAWKGADPSHLTGFSQRTISMVGDDIVFNRCKRVKSLLDLKGLVTIRTEKDALLYVRIATSIQTVPIFPFLGEYPYTYEIAAFNEWDDSFFSGDNKARTQWLDSPGREITSGTLGIVDDEFRRAHHIFPATVRKEKDGFIVERSLLHYHDLGTWLPMNVLRMTEYVGKNGEYQPTVRREPLQSPAPKVYLAMLIDTSEASKAKLAAMLRDPSLEPFKGRYMVLNHGGDMTDVVAERSIAKQLEKVMEESARRHGYLNWDAWNPYKPF